MGLCFAVGTYELWTRRNIVSHHLWHGPPSSRPRPLPLLVTVYDKRGVLYSNLLWNIINGYCTSIISVQYKWNDLYHFFNMKHHTPQVTSAQLKLLLFSNSHNKQENWCLWYTNAPNEGQYHKDKYLATSRKILSQDMLTCNIKHRYGMSNVIFF